MALIVVTVYLLGFLGLLVFGGIVGLTHNLPVWLNTYHIAYFCTLSGGLGGLTYCLRSVYFHKSVRKDWDRDWHVWYVIRPFQSLIMGLLAFIFLSAGLMVLNADSKPESAHWGYLALSFVAGLKVEMFLDKIEEISKTVWGIAHSRLLEDSKKIEKRRDRNG